VSPFKRQGVLFGFFLCLSLLLWMTPLAIPPIQADLSQLSVPALLGIMALLLTVVLLPLFASSVLFGIALKERGPRAAGRVLMGLYLFWYGYLWYRQGHWPQVGLDLDWLLGRVGVRHPAYHTVSGLITLGLNLYLFRTVGVAGGRLGHALTKRTQERMKRQKESYTIAVLPGDGIGREIVPEAVKVLEAAGKRFGLRFEFREAAVGGGAIDRFGIPLPDDSLKTAMESDAVLLGAVGGPKWEGLPYAVRPERALLGLREKLGLYANLRPARPFSCLLDSSTLKREVIEGVDLLVVRELTGGIYFGRPRGVEPHEGGERGINTEVYTTEEIRRIARVAFEAARNRRKKVTSVDKANVLESSELWRRVVTELHREYPDVELQHLYVDNCAMQLISKPKQFDVIVTTNLFGDILSDEAAQLTGSIGLLPSASLGGATALYEPIHGSAPDIAGLDQANPIATILSAAMMLRHSFDREEPARAIEAAAVRVLEQGIRTGDIWSEGCRRVGTREMGDLIVQEILRC
jgi:3-isopropylmalate dehydrogenase